MVDINKQNKEEIVLDHESTDTRLHHEHIDDLVLIQIALFNKLKIVFTLTECCDIWDDYSDSLQASWMCVPNSSADIVKSIESERRFKGWDYYKSKFTNGRD